MQRSKIINYAVVLWASTAPCMAIPVGAQSSEIGTAASTTNHKYGFREPLPKADGTIRIATYNVENLFDPFDDPTLQGEFDDAGMITSPERCQAVADAIRKVDADVLALEEIESLKCLTWFRDTYLADMGYEFLASEDVAYYRGIECSVMSRFEIMNIEVRPGVKLDDVVKQGPGWSEVPENKRSGLVIQRSPIRVDIRVNDDYELTLVALHHKAGGGNRFHREAEAIVNNLWLDEMEADDPARNIIVLGDFNAAPWDKSLRLYLENGFVDSLAQRIIPHWANAEQTEANLHKTHSSGRVIDYVLLNSAAFRELVVGSAHVFGTLTPPEDWNWRTDPYPANYAADHFPVIVDLVPHNRP